MALQGGLKRKSQASSDVPNSSMADIAFLLLIFFLVTTTMEKETGIKKSLPQKVEKQPDIKILNRDLLDIRVNLNDQLLVEGKISEVDQLYGIAREFLTNEMNAEKYPSFELISKDKATTQVAYWKEQVASAKVNSPEQVVAEKKLEEWQDRLTTLKAIDEPSFRQISKMAVMTIDMDNKSSYGRYIEILSELQAAQNDLRDEVSLKYFGVKYTELDSEDDADKILAVQTIVPQRIIKKEK